MFASGVGFVDDKTNLLLEDQVMRIDESYKNLLAVPPNL